LDICGRSSWDVIVIANKRRLSTTVKGAYSLEILSTNIKSTTIAGISSQMAIHAYVILRTVMEKHEIHLQDRKTRKKYF
jgi:hypothetical protein